MTAPPGSEWVLLSGHTLLQLRCKDGLGTEVVPRSCKAAADDSETDAQEPPLASVWDRIILGLLGQEFDIIISGMSITEASQHALTTLFEEPIGEFPEAMALRKGDLASLNFSTAGSSCIAQTVG